ncbi:MAG: bifunctional heptose 7-phosphate kinase/heptose 1-phosphate adenyltransferase [Phaeodactylibacter xiamenensis]|jgi:rfaE bifunctional protein kinase chain/domain|uniref:Carbohydrate kinase n=1 Tax=Phaeodactylibacter xiamenensis TaxID=1524460 RepID=A0A098S1S1_9BACT|nr:bifunctional ADP-heptose synthase [Phaeodactylibacter xiamenensis]KGE85092.1 carbohydrate kinase [Phaeodactylibacter xiamenensis]MCR9051293.1 bifunctional ADP-heptose synthase [bacterium]
MISNLKAFTAFEQQNILIIGDVMIDRYLNGSVDRISPEAPVPVVRLTGQEDRLGGAANVALNLKALGATPYLCSVIGADENGGQLQQLLTALQFSDRGLLQSKERRTTVKSRVIAGNQHLLRVDAEDTHPLSATEQENLLHLITELLEQKEIHAILFQDYNKGVLSYPVIRAVILEAIKRDIPTAVDPKFDNFWSYKHVTLFKPNLKEIRAQMPFEVQPTLEDLNKAADHLRNKLGNPYSLVTLSERGIYLNNRGEGQTIPTHPRSITDVCGAGDTVFAVAGLGLSLGMPLEEIARLSNLAGGQVCERVGVVPVNREQLEQEYQQLLSEGEIS